jgi:hypothetical protein
METNNLETWGSESGRFEKPGKRISASPYEKTLECALPLLGIEEPSFLIDFVTLEFKQDGQLGVCNLFGLPLNNRDNLISPFNLT